MALQIRRGTEATRATTLFKSGELIYTTDQKDLWVGDGVTNGGTQIAPVKSVNGSTGTVVLTTDQVSAGSTNKYYSATQARIDAGAALTAGNAGNTGITFSYNSGTNVINAVITNAGGLSSVSGDTNPALGGNLSLNSRNITGTGNINITGTVTATSFTGPINTDAITPVTSTILYGKSEVPLTVRGIPSAGSSVCIDINTFKGTVLSPTNTVANDQVGSFRTAGYYNGNFKPASTLTTVWTSDVDLTTNNPKSILYFSTGNNNAVQSSPSASLDGNGTFTARIIQAPSYATGSYPAGGTITPLAGVVITGTGGQFSCTSTVLSVGGTVTITGTLGGTGTISGYASGNTYYIIATNGSTTFTLSTASGGSAITTTAGTPTGLTYNVLLPAKGMIIFDSTTNHFMGYNGTNWVAFTGP